jgi:hypothetical protein
LLFAPASMPQAITLAPPDASLFAMARPIPVVPVTTATLPSNSFMGNSSLLYLFAAISTNRKRITFPALTPSGRRKAEKSLLFALPYGNG